MAPPRGRPGFGAPLALADRETPPRWTEPAGPALLLTLLVLTGPGCGGDALPPPEPPLAGRAASTVQDPLPLSLLLGDAPAPTEAGGWLGVELRAVEDGVVVAGVVRGSPAHEAGLARGDRLLSVDGRAVATPAEVRGAIASRPPGAEVAVGLRRGSGLRLMRVRLAALPDPETLLRGQHLGMPAPPLDVKAVTGSVVPDLGSLRGKVVVLEFWAPWCAACRVLAPWFNDRHAEWRSEGVVLVGVTQERVETAFRAARELGIEYPVAADTSGAATEAYGAFALPTVFVVDRRGVVRDVLVGFDQARLAGLEALLRRLSAEAP